MVEPVQLGRGAASAAGAASGAMQRKLRKKSERAEEPRVFSQAKILVSIGVPLSVIMTVTMYFPISEYVQGSSDDVLSVIIPGLITLACYTLLAHGLFRRFGVDREKVLTRFGKLFYRQVRFEHINRFDSSLGRFKLQDVEVDDPGWEDAAQGFRNLFASQAYRNHQAFYDSHPEELDRLQALVQPPKPEWN